MKFCRLDKLSVQYFLLFIANEQAFFNEQIKAVYSKGMTCFVKYLALFT